jgi:hypothetical protein
MFWLPLGGFGNAVPARAWAEVADLSTDEVADVLMALADAGIAGYIAVPHRPRDAARRYSVDVRYRLWVDSLRYLSAENVLMEVLARLHGRRPPGGRSRRNE